MLELSSDFAREFVSALLDWQAVEKRSHMKIQFRTETIFIEERFSTASDRGNSKGGEPPFSTTC